MKLITLLVLPLLIVIITVVPIYAQTPSTQSYQKCIVDNAQSLECCEAHDPSRGSEINSVSHESCDKQFEIVKVIIPIIGIMLLVGGIIGAVIWERRRLS